MVFLCFSVILNQFNDETKNYTENDEYKIICYAIDVHRRAIEYVLIVILN